MNPFVGILCNGFEICKVNVLIIKNYYRSPHGFIVFLAVSIRSLCSQKPKKRKREVDRKNKETKKLCVQHSENFPFITMHLSCHHSNYGELTKNRPTFALFRLTRMLLRLTRYKVQSNLHLRLTLLSDLSSATATTFRVKSLTFSFVFNLP